MKTKHRFLTMMLALVAMLMGTRVMAEKQPYVVYSVENKTLTFYYDENMSTNDGILIEEDYGEGFNDIPSWNMSLGTTKVVFDSSFAGYQPTTTRSWFSQNFSQLKEIEGLKYLDTSKVKDMWLMFRGCSALEELDLSSLKTSNVERMASMFLDCQGLKKLNVSFDTSKVTEMSEMFCNCSQLEELDVSSFDTGSVIYMQGVFSYCTSLKRLDIRNFNTSNVVNMAYLFEGCTALESVDFGKSNTSNLINMEGMFSACKSLTTIDLSSFDTHNVTNMSHLFFVCDGLTTIYVGNKWSTSKVNDWCSDNLFEGCINLKGGNGTGYSLDNPTDVSFARIDGKDGKKGYLTAAPQPSISTGIENAQRESVKGQKGGWYTIDGQKIGGKPTKKGVYINNGKKTIVE